MISKHSNKRKIINDPVYGFITIPNDFIYDLIEHPWFQRLRRIKQLGLSHLVYPGALHTRFHHALGAMHLMGQALHILQQKDIEITEDEQEAVLICILLHDIGHGPFSHALEHSIVNGMQHEMLSIIFLETLNKQLDGRLSLALAIFTNQYPKKFLHQLVSSQLDMDRLDYLKRDTFFTGVSEGTIGIDRIIKMLNVVDDQLVIEEKGLYSIEKYIIARRLMYWQVYLHKTVLSAEYMLMRVLQRARELSLNGEDLFASPALQIFLKQNIKLSDFEECPEILNAFGQLDDFDIGSAIKVWANHDDVVLSKLCSAISNRKLFKILIQKEAFSEEIIQEYRQKAIQHFRISEEESTYIVFADKTSNAAYKFDTEQIHVLRKNGELSDFDQVSEQFTIDALGKIVTKHFLCVPNEILR